MGMKRVSVTALLAVFVAASGPAAAEESSVGVDVSMDFYGKYVWRGQNLVDDWVFQPGASFSYGGFTGGIWGNSDIHGDAGDNEDFEFTEWDFYGDYSGTVPGVEWLGYSVGVIYYYFPGDMEETTEVYWGLNVDTFLNPTLTVFHDVDEADGTYVSFGVGHSIEEVARLSEDVSIGLDFGLAVGWGDSDYNEFYWGSSVDSSEMNDLSAQIAFPVAMGSWTLTPSVNYVTLLSDDIRDNNGYSDDNDFLFAGLSLSTSF